MRCRWFPFAMALLLTLPAPALAHNFTIYCGINAEPGALVAGAGGTLDVHIYDNFGNGLPGADVKVIVRLARETLTWTMTEHDDGHYTAFVRFPTPGTWDLRVQMVSQSEVFRGSRSVSVAPPGGATAGLDNAAVLLIQTPQLSALPAWVYVAAALALFLAAMGLASAWRRRLRRSDPQPIEPQSDP